MKEIDKVGNGVHVGEGMSVGVLVGMIGVAVSVDSTMGVNVCVGSVVEVAALSGVLINCDVHPTDSTNKEINILDFTLLIFHQLVQEVRTPSPSGAPSRPPPFTENENGGGEISTSLKYDSCMLPLYSLLARHFPSPNSRDKKAGSYKSRVVHLGRGRGGALETLAGDGNL